MRTLLGYTVERHGRLGLLFNNAGTFSPAPSSAPREAFRFMRHQQPRGGRIMADRPWARTSPR